LRIQYSFGPEAEFFVFDEVSFHNEGHTAGFSLDSPEAIWNTNGANGNGNKGFHIRNKEGYVPLPPLDTLQDFRGFNPIGLSQWVRRGR